MSDKNRSIPKARQVSLGTNSMLATLIVLTLLSCRLAGEFVSANQKFPTSTSPSVESSEISRTDTPQPSYTPRPTFTSLPSPTATPTHTSTFTLPPPTPTFTSSPTPTPLPPTLTSGPGQLTSGYQVWTLIHSEVSPYLTIWEYSFPPLRVSPNVGGGYQYLRLVFDCTTGAPLTSLLTSGKDHGLTLLGHRDGFSEIFVRDQRGKDYPVQFISTCWLAAPVDPAQSGFTLHFLGLEPLPAYPLWTN